MLSFLHSEEKNATRQTHNQITGSVAASPRTCLQTESPGHRRRASAFFAYRPKRWRDRVDTTEISRASWGPYGQAAKSFGSHAAGHRRYWPELHHAETEKAHRNR